MAQQYRCSASAYALSETCLSVGPTARFHKEEDCPLAASWSKSESCLATGIALTAACHEGCVAHRNSSACDRTRPQSEHRRGAADLRCPPGHESVPANPSAYRSGRRRALCEAPENGDPDHSHAEKK